MMLPADTVRLTSQERTSSFNSSRDWKEKLRADDAPLVFNRPLAGSARTLLWEVRDRRLDVGRIRRWISVNLPRLASGLPALRRHPCSDRVVRLFHAIVRAAVDRDGSLARRHFGRVHLAGTFKARLDTEVAQYRRARLSRVVVQKNVVAVGPQAWLTLPKAGPHAAPTAPGGTSRPTAANLRG